MNRTEINIMSSPGGKPVVRITRRKSKGVFRIKRYYPGKASAARLERAVNDLLHQTYNGPQVTLAFLNGTVFVDIEE